MSGHIKEADEVASLQRQRLRRIPDPIKYLLAVGTSGYDRLLYNDYEQHNLNLHSKTFANSYLLYLGAIPLTFATKSLVAPVMYVMGLRFYKFQMAQCQDCFFCTYMTKGQERNKLAQDRETVLRAIYLAKGNADAKDSKPVVRLDSLEALDKYLTDEVTRRDATLTQSTEVSK